MKTLLLVGSPKGKASTSVGLGRALLERMGEDATETAYIYPALRSEEKLNTLYQAVEQAELVLLVAPLYVDGVPGGTLHFMEGLARYRKAHEGERDQRLAVIVNCGFPEAAQNETALRIYGRFAEKAGFEWAGGVAVGAGTAALGQGLSEPKGMVTDVVNTLDEVAAALTAGRPLAGKGIALAQPRIPPRMYAFMGKVGWWLSARKNGVLGKLGAKPYAKG